MTGNIHPRPLHRPVMLHEVLAFLAPKPGDVIVDGTMGCGGHALEILERIMPGGQLIGIDRDPDMIRESAERIGDRAADEVQLFNANFSRIDEMISRAGVSAVDGVLIDNGASSPQLDRPERGFSYRQDGPLTMQMTPGEGSTAAELLTSLPAPELERIFAEYGEERYARRIARAVVARRGREPLKRTRDFAALIERAVPHYRRRLHPARRCFQALRIACNDELRHLKTFFEKLPAVLVSGGRLVVLSYHSLEDRIAKRALREGQKAGEYELLTKKPLRPSEDEARENPRSRSAKLRAARRL